MGKFNATSFVALLTLVSAVTAGRPSRQLLQEAGCPEGEFLKEFDGTCMACDEQCAVACVDNEGCNSCNPGYFTSKADPEWPNLCSVCNIENCDKCRDNVFDAWPMQCVQCAQGYSQGENRESCIPGGNVGGAGAERNDFATPPPSSGTISPSTEEFSSTIEIGDSQTSTGGSTSTEVTGAGESGTFTSTTTPEGTTQASSVDSSDSGPTSTSTTVTDSGTVQDSSIDRPVENPVSASPSPEVGSEGSGTTGPEEVVEVVEVTEVEEVGGGSADSGKPSGVGGISSSTEEATSTIEIGDSQTSTGGSTSTEITGAGESGTFTSTTTPEGTTQASSVDSSDSGPTSTSTTVTDSGTVQDSSIDRPVENPVSASPSPEVGSEGSGTTGPEEVVEEVVGEVVEAKPEEPIGGGSVDGQRVEGSPDAGSETPVTCEAGSFRKEFDNTCMQCDANCKPGDCVDGAGCNGCVDGYFTSAPDPEWPFACKLCTINNCAECMNKVFDAWPQFCVRCNEGFTLQGRTECVASGGDSSSVGGESVTRPSPIPSPTSEVEPPVVVEPTSVGGVSVSGGDDESVEITETTTTTEEPTSVGGESISGGGDDGAGVGGESISGGGDDGAGVGGESISGGGDDGASVGGEEVSSQPPAGCPAGSFLKPFDGSCMVCDESCVEGGCVDEIGCTACRPETNTFRSRPDPEWPFTCESCTISSCTKCVDGVFDAWPMRCEECAEGFQVSRDGSSCESL